MAGQISRAAAGFNPAARRLKKLRPGQVGRGSSALIPSRPGDAIPCAGSLESAGALREARKVARRAMAVSPSRRGIGTPGGTTRFASPEHEVLTSKIRPFYDVRHADDPDARLRSCGAVEAARAGAGHSFQGGRQPNNPGRFGRRRRRPAPKTIPHSFGFMPGVDLDKLGQLADELEAEAFADKPNDSARHQRPRSRAQR